MLTDEELALDTTTQGNMLRAYLYNNPSPLLKAITAKPPRANCENNHAYNTDKYIPIM